MNLLKLTLLLTVLASSLLLADEKPDYAREQRIAEQIEPDIFDGEAVWLSASEHQFLAIHLEAENSSGAVIVMHGRDSSPEEQYVAGPLRVELAEHGWTTLALQMPVLEKGKTYYDYIPIFPMAHKRIEAAIKFLRDQGEKTIILASHSCSAHMTNDWLNNTGDGSIQGYIAIGLGATDAGQKLKTSFPIGNMQVPVLDIYGTEEFPAPLSMLPERRNLLEKNGHPSSKQVAVEDADHYFTDASDALVEQVVLWLKQSSFQ